MDLGGARTIHHVVIQYATGNDVWGTVCFEMYIYIIYCVELLKFHLIYNKCYHGESYRNIR